MSIHEVNVPTSPDEEVSIPSPYAIFSEEMKALSQTNSLSAQSVRVRGWNQGRRLIV